MWTLSVYYSVPGLELITNWTLLYSHNPRLAPNPVKKTFSIKLRFWCTFGFGISIERQKIDQKIILIKQNLSYKL